MIFINDISNLAEQAKAMFSGIINPVGGQVDAETISQLSYIQKARENSRRPLMWDRRPEGQKVSGFAAVPSAVI